jgi:exo-1,4-beta-D-glucosaminidase
MSIKRFAILLSVSVMVSAAEEEPGTRMLLRQGWAIGSSADVHESGAALSTPDVNTRNWYRATLPSTVVSALVADRVYPDPYFGMNLRSISGTSYPISTNFSGAQMPPDSPFRHSWWYRTVFDLPAEYRGKTIWLGFDGINFRANVWMNGKQIAAADKMAGAWRLFEFDVTAAAQPGGKNSLAIEVFPPDPHDLAITFVDWNPMPPDKDMGIWRDVYISATGPVAIRFPNVITHLNMLSVDSAQLTVTAQLKNASGANVDGVLKGKIEGIEFSQPVQLGPHEPRVVRFTPDKFAQLKIEHAKLWWPAQVGGQDLYPLDLQFEAGGQLSDASHIQFGIREVTAQVDDKGHLLFRINGKNILIRGAGYTFDMMLRASPERQENELKYVRDMNLNTVRLEGKIEDDHFLELCDRYGILVMAGWCCCDHWERWGTWDDEDERIAAESLRDQIRRIERHPSVFDWMYGSDNPPPPKIENMYLKILEETDWPNPHQSSATDKPTSVTGKTGVKMLGPYEYVAPVYWYLDTKNGGAYGFNTETGPGPAPPPLESLRRMLPEDHLWPIDSWWDYHAGGGAFRNIKVFTEALDARYGAPVSVEDFSRKSQVMAYETHRAMFEAYGRNKYTATGVIQWMLNNAWPGMIWHLYDWYLRPGGSYFGAKKACEPLHVQYSNDDQSIVVVNSYYKPFANLKVGVKVYNINMAEKFSKQATLDAGPDSSTRVLALPEIDGLSSTYFVSLTLEEPSGNTVSRNFYWLSTKPETLDWDKTDWYHTPTKTFADFKALNGLPLAGVTVAAKSEVRASEGVTTVTLRNTSQSIAFAVHLKVKKGPEGDEVLPVLWQDNYFPLLPGESREVTATYNARDGRNPVVEVDGWNVERTLAGNQETAQANR